MRLKPLVLLAGLCLPMLSPVRAEDLPPGMTPQMLLQMLVTRSAAMQGNPQQEQAAPLAIESRTEAQLAAWPKAPSGLVIEGMRDGFNVNGKRFIDPEGRIVKYGSDAMTGNVSYLVEQSSQSYLVKMARAGGAVEPVTIAVASRAAGNWQVTTASGKKLVGDRLIPTSTGLLVGRGNTGFLYETGKGATSFAGQEDFDIAAFQSGDIGSTGYVLLERRQQVEAQDSASKLFNSVKALGSMVGVTEKQDYQLLNVKTGKAVSLNIPIDNKSVTVGASGCVQQNRFAQRCTNFEFAESLYDTSGLPNYGHYFWRIRRYKTANRSVVFALEDGLRHLNAIDLDSQAKVTLFDRVLGIGGFRTEVNGEGKISVIAKMGFSEERKDDAVGALN
ncbi:hypothetical protein ABWL39_10450 [Chitinivorax sp. PXF-14]|uniref:hypothetical protein n=1 Tax=Chitinivorax sp. PXF-14 TaxID=3230488 RepID=UPI003465430D